MAKNVRLPPFSADRARQLLNYDPLTGIFTWRAREAGAGRAWSSGKRAGKRAGQLCPDGRRLIGLCGVRVYASRLAWYVTYDTWPGTEIDHINLDTNDDRIANLRAATRSENSRNRSRQSNNTSGHRGVTWDKSQQRWRAYITISGRQIELGRHASFDAAVAAYRAAAAEHFGEFARLD